MNETNQITTKLNLNKSIKYKLYIKNLPKKALSPYTHTHTHTQISPDQDY